MVSGFRNPRSSVLIVFSLVSLLSILVVVLVAMGVPAGVSAAKGEKETSAIASAAAADNYVALCRYGISADESQGHIVSLMGAGWFLKFNHPKWGTSLPANNAEQAHVIKTFQQKSASGEYLPDYSTSVPLDAALATLIRENPGHLWLIGNEVDRKDKQGDMYPDIYAKAFHEVSSFIKYNDPSARVAISGLVEMTPGRRQYLDMVWNAYLARYGKPMHVDVWNMHAYVLPEVRPDGVTPNGVADVAVGTDPALGKRESASDPNSCAEHVVYCRAEHDDISVFAEQIVMMRQWMKEHGQQQKPLIVSEYSILYRYYGVGSPFSVRDEYGNYFTPERVSKFMLNSFDYLNGARDPNLGFALDDNRLVQQWLWYTAHESLGNSSQLMEADLATMTLMGQTYRNHVYNEAAYVNLLVSEVPDSVTTLGEGGTATARLDVVLRNNGNITSDAPFTVTFYADEERTQPIDSVTVSPLLRGCASDRFRASVDWTGLKTPGIYQFWVYIDSRADIDENPADDTDNLGTGYVLVTAERNLIPLIRR